MPAPLDFSRSTPLYQQVAEHLAEQVRRGDLTPGTKLPPYRALAADYGVSMMTINKALSGLIAEGLLTSRVGRGTFVAEQPEPEPAADAPAPMLGFVLRDLTAVYFSEIVRAAEQRAAAAGYRLLFTHAAEDADAEDAQIRHLLQLGARGLLIASVRRTYAASPAVRELHEGGVPYTIVSFMHDDDVHLVVADSEAAGFAATEHLIGQGYRRIGYVGDGRHSMAGDLRKKGYRRALERHGVPLHEEYTYTYPFEGEVHDYRSGYEVGRRLLADEDRPDALFVFNDLGAIGLMDAALDRGLDVPGDLALVGVDDLEQSRHARVPLTTVRQPRRRIGEEAVEVVLDLVAGRPTQTRRIMAPELVVRASTAPKVEEG